LKEKVIIIAEAGVNHNGDISIAKKLIDVAAESGADYVKFQTFKAKNIVTLTANKAKYQISNSNNESQFEMLKKLELSKNDHKELINHCKKRNISFFSTAFDCEGLEYLNNLNFHFFKIPSGEITNYLYLKKIALIGKPVILSTGMSNMSEIAAAVKLLISENLSVEDITILHCNTEYPTPMLDVNLKAMLSIKKKFNVEVGYSDHTLGIEIPIAAVAMGAKVIEKHFTLNRNLKGPDHASSLEPDELSLMVKSIRNVELACLGDGIKIPSKSEIKNIKIVRKSMHVVRDIKNGEILNKHDIVILRPNNGINPMEWNKVIGKKLIKNIRSGECLTWDYIK
jgi:N,N'-diacetyllegionaminate synthase